MMDRRIDIWDEEGGITALSLLMLIGALVLGGLAIDFANGQSAKTQLQITADAAAHAALVTRELHSAAEAKTVALTVAADNMPSSKFGTVLSAEDIQFGKWDAEKQVFTADPNSKDAVYVRTRREASRGNGLITYMMGTVGKDVLDVNAGSVFETYTPICFKEGFAAQGVVDMQSNSAYVAGFCVHSQSHVSLSSNNAFDPGVVVSMPDTRDVDLPSSGYESNPGLRAALRPGSYVLKILSRIDDIIRGIRSVPFDTAVGIMAPSSVYYRPYITDPTPVTVKAQGATSLDQSKFQPGHIHVMECKNDMSHKQFGAGFTFKNMVLVTDCRLQFASGAVLEDAVIITTNTDAKSLYASSDIVIGRNDDCADGGDVQMVTLGGVEFAAKVNIYGSQIIAAGDISMTANGDGIEGAALVAGGRIDVTSNGKFGFCGGDGLSNNYSAEYFRLAH